MIKQFIQNQKERISRVYHRIRNLWPIWFYVLNFEGRRLYNKNQGYKELDKIEKGILDDLNRDGIATVHISKLFEEDKFSEIKNYVMERWNNEETQKKVAEKKSAPESRGDKYYNIDLWETPKILNMENPYIKFCLDKKILKIANNYLKMYSKWRGWNLWASLPVDKNMPEHASQNWHRDPEDKKMLKMFVYYNDIDSEAGPFMYLKKSHHGGKWRNLFPQIPPIGFYPPKGAVEKKVSAEDIYQAVGKTGTVVFCDTSGLHKGGYCKSKMRLMSQSIYGSSASLEPINYRYSKTLLYATLLPEVRYALTNKE